LTNDASDVHVSGLLSGYEREELRDRMQQYFKIAALKIRCCQKVRTGHVQTISAQPMGPQHDGRRLDRLLNDGNLVIVDREVTQKMAEEAEQIPALSNSAGFCTRCRRNILEPRGPQSFDDFLSRDSRTETESILLRFTNTHRC
jgi:hypothetical protein